MPSRRALITMKVVLWVLCLLPLALLGLKFAQEGLGANPIEVITHATGDWTMRLLLATLAITPVRKLTGRLWLIRFRRPLGLFAFFYGVLHFTTYVWLDKFFDLHDIIGDVYKRRFISVGFLAFVLMIPLALTSTQWAIRKLKKNWQLVHRLIYASAVAGVIHYWWLVKADIALPAVYAGILGVLLLYRLVTWAMPSGTATKAAAAAEAE